MLLYRKGLHLNNDDEINENTKMAICDCCVNDLKKEKIPHFSAGNKMWIGDVPCVLKDLTIPEMRLIARYRHNNCIIKLRSFSNDANSAQSALKGNVVTFVQHLSNIAKTLPISLNDLCSEIKIIFVGTKVTVDMSIHFYFSFIATFSLQAPDRYNLRQVLTVRRENVSNALKWLKLNNRLYQDVVSFFSLCKLCQCFYLLIFS